jgi:hypothetical protein
MGHKSDQFVRKDGLVRKVAPEMSRFSGVWALGGGVRTSRAAHRDVTNGNQEPFWTLLRTIGV